MRSMGFGRGEGMSGEQVLETEQRNTLLEFTGNWFIDAGILGFVNLMEEIRWKKRHSFN